MLDTTLRVATADFGIESGKRAGTITGDGRNHRKAVSKVRVIGVLRLSSRAESRDPASPQLPSTSDGSRSAVLLERLRMWVDGSTFLSRGLA